MDFSENILGTCLQEHSIYAIYLKEIPFFWTEIHEKEFFEMKSAITSPECMLLHPEWSSEFELHVDGSKKGIGVMLAQKHNGKLRPVRFGSRCFTKFESIWNTLHQELFAVKYWLETFGHYLL